jgi:AcrR family transcriptional regulator
MSVAQSSTTSTRRRDVQREETRRDLAIAAFEQASAKGLANVRVPEIAAAAGVSTRTFNNYFPSKEAAITWPAARRAAQEAENLLARPAEESLSQALLAATSEVYGAPRKDGLPADWLRKFRALVASEPGLRGEYLKAAQAAERALAGAIAVRTGAGEDELEPKVLAAVVVAAERAAVMHWMKQDDKAEPLRETVRAAVQLALSEVDL